MLSEYPVYFVLHIIQCADEDQINDGTNVYMTLFDLTKYTKEKAKYLG